MTKARYLLISLWIYYLQTGRRRRDGLLALGAVLVLCSCIGVFSLLPSQESADPGQVPAETGSPTGAPDIVSTRYSTRSALATHTPRPSGTPAPTSSPVSIATAVPVAPKPSPTQSRAVVRIIEVDKGAEFLDIRNEGLETQDLSGWLLVSDKGQQACALGGVLGAGETLRVWSRAEDLGKGGYNCGLADPVWHDLEGDPVVLYNASGEEVDRVQSRP